MANIHQINKDTFRFELYNLNYFKECDTDIFGHYTFWYHKPTNRFAFAKHGDYGGLTWFPEVNEDLRFPTENEADLLNELVFEKTIRRAYFWNYNAPRFHAGRYLLDELEETCEKDEDGWGTEWFKRADNEYFDQVMKVNCIFDCDYPSDDYKLDKDHWDKLKEKDKKAIELLK